MRYISVMVSVDITAEDEEAGEEKVKAGLDKEFPDEYTVTGVTDHGEAK